MNSSRHLVRPSPHPISEPDSPRHARDARVRARCHAAMTATVRQPKPPARAAWRALDLLLPVAAALYGVTIVVEALRIIVSLG